MGFNAKNIKMGNIPIEEKVGPSKGLPSLMGEVQSLLDEVKVLRDENENLKSLVPNPITEILTQDEIMFLIQYIGEANFKGKDVEKIYSIVLKLQNLYVYYQKKK